MKYPRLYTPEKMEKIHKKTTCYISKECRHSFEKEIICPDSYNLHRFSEEIKRYCSYGYRQKYKQRTSNFRE